jgi:hypothetical protein
MKRDQTYVPSRGGSSKKQPPRSYKLNTGLEWKSAKGQTMRAEEDEVRNDIPADSVAWLLEAGLISEHDPAQAIKEVEG